MVRGMKGCKGEGWKSKGRRKEKGEFHEEGRGRKKE